MSTRGLPQGRELKGMLGDGSWSYWEQMGRDGIAGQGRGGGRRSASGWGGGGRKPDRPSPGPLGS